MLFDSGVFSGGTELSFLAAMKQSVASLINDYDLLGDVKVNVITFDGKAVVRGATWQTADTAKSSVNGITISPVAGEFDGTNYDDALNMAMYTFENSAGGRYPTGQNILYFLSDGDPTKSFLHSPPATTYDTGPNNIGTTGPDPLSGRTLDDGIDSNEEADWSGFLRNFDIKAYAIGLGPDVSTVDLDRIAYNGIGDTNLDSTIVNNLNNLDDTVDNTITAPPLNGTLLDGTNAAAGADGGRIQSVDVNGVTYRYDGTRSSGTSGTFNGATKEWAIPASGAVFKINMDTGAYSYAPPVPLVATMNLAVTYTVRDGDGDTAASTLTLSYSLAAAPIAVDLGASGIEYLSLEQSGISQSPLGLFNVAWIGAEDGLLAYDYNGDGLIAEAREFVFTLWGDRSDVTTDMEALAAYFDGDSMGVKDGLLDPSDLSWPLFGVWQDMNTNGIQEAGEFSYLADWGVASIALSYSASSSAYATADGDVRVYGQMAITFVDGSTGLAEDVAFAVSRAQSQVSDPSTTGHPMDAFSQNVVMSDEHVVPPELASVADLVEQFVGQNAATDEVMAEYQQELALTELPAAAEMAGDPAAIEPIADALAGLDEAAALLLDDASDAMATATDGVDAFSFFV